MIRKFILPVLLLFAACSTEENIQKVSNVFRGEKVITDNTNRIYILPFRDRTDNPRLSEETGVLLKNKIGSDGRLAVVDSRAESDIQLSVELTVYENQSTKFDASGTVTEKRLRTVAIVSMLRTGRKEPVFWNNRVETFFVFSEINPPVINEYRALSLLADTLAARIQSVVMTGWYTDLMTDMERGKKSGK